MADRKMGVLSEQRAEAGRKSKFLQEMQPAPDTYLSGSQSEVQNVGSDGNIQNPSTAILASSRSRDSLKF